MQVKDSLRAFTKAATGLTMAAAILGCAPKSGPRYPDYFTYVASTGEVNTIGYQCRDRDVGRFSNVSLYAVENDSYSGFAGPEFVKGGSDVFPECTPPYNKNPHPSCAQPPEAMRAAVKARKTILQIAQAVFGTSSGPLRPDIENVVLQSGGNGEGGASVSAPPGSNFRNTYWIACAAVAYTPDGKEVPGFVVASSIEHKEKLMPRHGSGHPGGAPGIFGFGGGQNYGSPAYGQPYGGPRQHYYPSYQPDLLPPAFYKEVPGVISPQAGISRNNEIWKVENFGLFIGKMPDGTFHLINPAASNPPPPLAPERRNTRINAAPQGQPVQ